MAGTLRRVEAKPKLARPRALDLAGGWLLALLALVLGLLLEGGHLRQILEPTAALIVMGGTAGAVLVHFPLGQVRAALGALKAAFQSARPDAAKRSAEILRLAGAARRGGTMALDPELQGITDPFFRKAMMLAVDGFRADELREIMEFEQLRLCEDAEIPARVWEAAGGFAPTLGILGAVLGLIQVMERLSDLASVGHGIAVAFVATVYGVGSANLLFLPVAGRLRVSAREAQLVREVTVEGVLAIVEGANTRTVRERIGVVGEKQAQLVVK
jgi:chemotaxis protein MotA